MMFHDGWWGYGSSWEAWVMMVFMVLLVVAVVAAVIYLVRSAASRGTAAPVPHASSPAAAHGPQQVIESPQDILKRRYAAGDIDRDEYLQKLEDLEKH